MKGKMMQKEQPEALRLPTLPFTVFDEFGQPCEDRVHDHFAAAFEALRAQIGQGDPVGTAISYYTEDGHTKWTFQPTKLGWEMPQDSRANERGARSCFDVYTHPAPQDKRCPLCKYQHGHQIGCENNPVDIALKAQAAVVQQKPLTDEQINQMWSDAHNDTSTMSLIHVLARAVEAAHNIGEKK